MSKSKWFNIHSWVGLKLSVLLSFILITGTLAVVSHEIDWLTNSAKRVSPSSVDTYQWTKVYSNATQRYPNQIITHIRAPIHPWFSTEVTLLRQDNSQFRAFFHPSSGEFLGEGRWYNWQRVLRITHRHLMLPKDIGITIVGIFGVLLVISLITSIAIYPNWWRGFFRPPRTHHRKFFWADLHRLFGVWSMWFVLVIGVTGVWYLLEVSGLDADMPSKGKAQSPKATAQAVQPSTDEFATMLAKVESDFPDLVLDTIVLPEDPKDVVQFQGQAGAVLVRPRANLVAYDPVTGEHVTQYRAEELSFHARISEAADPLHFGTFAGMPSKLIYFVFGVMLSALAVSGTYIYGMRVARIHREEPSPANKTWKAALGTMGWGKWVSMILLSTCLVITVFVFAGVAAV